MFPARFVPIFSWDPHPRDWDWEFFLQGMSVRGCAGCSWWDTEPEPLPHSQGIGMGLGLDLPQFMFPIKPLFLWLIPWGLWGDPVEIWEFSGMGEDKDCPSMYSQRKLFPRISSGGTRTWQFPLQGISSLARERLEIPSRWAPADPRCPHGMGTGSGTGSVSHGMGTDPQTWGWLLLDQVREQSPIPQLHNSTLTDPRLFFPPFFPLRIIPKTPEAEPGGSTLPLFSLWGPQRVPAAGRGRRGEATAIVTIPPWKGDPEGQQQQQDLLSTLWE